MTTTTKCLEYLNTAMGAAGNKVHKARCNVTRAHVECMEIVECHPELIESNVVNPPRPRPQPTPNPSPRNNPRAESRRPHQSDASRDDNDGLGRKRDHQRQRQRR